MLCVIAHPPLHIAIIPFFDNSSSFLHRLRGTYVPELKKVSQSIFMHNNNNNNGADGASGKKNKKNKKSEGGAEGDDGVVDMAQCGPGCVVM